MAQSGRPLKVDPKVDSILSSIGFETNEKVMQELSYYAIDIHDSFGRNALLNAVINNNSTIFNWTIERGTDINFQDKNGYSALHFAAQGNNLSFANVLVTAGANINITDNHGNSPIWTAIMNYNAGKNLNLILFLSEHGANIDLQNHYGRSPRDISGDLFDN